jgi:hypothetical protein
MLLSKRRRACCLVVLVMWGFSAPHGSFWGHGPPVSFWALPPGALLGHVICKPGSVCYWPGLLMTRHRHRRKHRPHRDRAKLRLAAAIDGTLEVAAASFHPLSPPSRLVHWPLITGQIARVLRVVR